MSTRTNHLGNRLIVYYGDAGSGKTYTAETEYPGSPSIICSETMTPATLLESGLREAMEEGESVILEGVNHLGEECLDFLAKICDGRTKYSTGNTNIEIKDGFKIVATSIFWEGDTRWTGYDRRVALLLGLVAGADARECYMTPRTAASILANLPS